MKRLKSITNKNYVSGFKQGYNKALDEVEKILQNEINNEKDAIDRKAIRNWGILEELRFIKDMLKELREK
jgi:antitoxin component HigA of HigAB toxin-antitoxin module